MSTSKLVDDESLKDIFANIEVGFPFFFFFSPNHFKCPNCVINCCVKAIEALHVQLLSDLKARMRRWTSPDERHSIGDVIIKLVCISILSSI